MKRPSSATPNIATVPGSGIFRTPNPNPSTKTEWFDAFNGIDGLDFYLFYTILETPSA